MTGLLKAVVEFESEAVGLLLYPQRIEDRKKAVKSLIENIEKQIHDTQEQIAGLSEDQPEQVLADKANKAIIREIPEQIQNCLAKIQGYQDKLKEQQTALARVQGQMGEAMELFIENCIGCLPLPSNLNPSAIGLETINQYFYSKRRAV